MPVTLKMLTSNNIIKNNNGVIEIDSTPFCENV